MNKKTTFIATGDCFMTRRLPEGGYEGFHELKDIIEGYDVKLTNLEITIHNKEGYPSAISGGTWAMAEPEILDDLKEYGFNLYNTANNHSGDYSHGGILATIRYLRERNMIYAGTGEHLAAASAPAYLETQNARIAMIGVCSTFHESDAAGHQSMDLPGRPGLNPLRFHKVYHVRKEYYDILGEIIDKTDMNASKELSIRNGYSREYQEGELYFGGLNFYLANENSTETKPLKKDMERIIENIKEASLQADYVIVNAHSHEFAGTNVVEPADFFKKFAYECIDAGADAILAHGPHELRGIELYKGKVIFYGLGNFIFQTETVALQPADAYENANMPNTTKVGEYMNLRSKNGTRGYVVQPNIWNSVMAGFTAVDGEITEITLYPISLGMKLPRSQRGFPKLLKNNEVLEYIAELSKPFGTKLEIADGVATIKVEK